MIFCIERVLREAEKELYELLNPKLEAEMLLCFVLQCNRVFLKTHSQKRISLWQFLLNKKCVQQRKKRIPLAYIRGYKEWGGMKILVNKNTLIPRDETEILCQHIREKKRDFAPKSFLDIGTGSGCIALFLAKSFPNANVLALDNSKKALRVVQKNTHILGFPVETIFSNLFENVVRNDFDILIANLPYVPVGMELLPELQKEPSGALFGGGDGLDVIRRLALQIQKKEILFKELWLEFLPSQKEAIQKLFSTYKITFFPDCEGCLFFALVERA